MALASIDLLVAVHLSQTVQLPNAVLPQDVTGALNFTSFTQPTIGRSWAALPVITTAFNL